MNIPSKEDTIKKCAPILEKSDYWLPPEVMKGLRQSGLSMTRRMKVAKIFKDESLYPVMKDDPIGITGALGHPGVSWFLSHYLTLYRL